jgi:pimeloyl-ACP methyl ester carboxylesterase
MCSVKMERSPRLLIVVVTVAVVGVNFKHSGLTRFGGTTLITVLLVHGVNADPSWQHRIAFVLYPHFAPVKITYTQFQSPGTISLLGLEGILRCLDLPFGVSEAAINTYRMGAMECVAQQMNKSMTGAPPHIIAHSFGTYLTAIIFERYDWARANRIIFCGSAVAEDFPWERVHRRTNFRELRNDWFPGDQVIKVADWVRAIPHFGCAGLRGFKMVQGFVHNLSGAAFACSNWRRGGCVPIHNVEREIAVGAEPAVVDHSLAYLTPASIAQFWLPYLWGLDAAEYEDLRELSRGTDEALRLGDRGTIRIKEKQLLARRYSWWPKPLLDHLNEVLNSEPYKDRWKGKTETEMQGRILSAFLAKINRAEMTQTNLITNCEKEGFVPDVSAWNSVSELHPHRAFFTAIRQIIDGD